MYSGPDLLIAPAAPVAPAAATAPDAASVRRVVDALAEVRFQLSATQVVLDGFVQGVRAALATPGVPQRPAPPLALARHLVPPPATAVGRR